jgi:hypothetical protein
MRTSGTGHSDAWMLMIPLAALLIFTSFASGGTHGLLYSLDSLLRGALRSAADLISRLL